VTAPSLRSGRERLAARARCRRDPAAPCCVAAPGRRPHAPSSRSAVVTTRMRAPAIAGDSARSGMGSNPASKMICTGTPDRRRCAKSVEGPRDIGEVRELVGGFVHGCSPQRRDQSSFTSREPPDRFQRPRIHHCQDRAASLDHLRERSSATIREREPCRPASLGPILAVAADLARAGSRARGGERAGRDRRGARAALAHADGARDSPGRTGEWRHAGGGRGHRLRGLRGAPRDRRRPRGGAAPANSRARRRSPHRHADGRGE